MSVTKTPSSQPGLLWRTASTFVMAATGLLSRSFLYGLNDVEVVGLDRFLALLDARRDPATRQQGLLTVSNHVSVMDDPLLWGVLPFRYTTDPDNLRWSLGSYDICYKNRFLGNFFYIGQTLPTHRLRHSPHGGLFQPTLDKAIGLLSSTTTTSSSSASTATEATSSPSSLFFSTNGSDRWPTPAAYASRRHAWVHIFPEGMVHQSPASSLSASPTTLTTSTSAVTSSLPLSSPSPDARGLRYFKWGVARLLLESEPAPVVVPIFVDGFDRVMPEDRNFPRFLPRIHQRIRIVFGDAIDPAVFADVRAKWRQLLATQTADDEDLHTRPEAKVLRIEAARRVRAEILKLRRQSGFADEDPSRALAETWADDPDKKRFRSKVDDSIVYRE